MTVLGKNKIQLHNISVLPGWIRSCKGKAAQVEPVRIDGVVRVRLGVALQDGQDVGVHPFGDDRVHGQNVGGAERGQQTTWSRSDVGI